MFRLCLVFRLLSLLRLYFLPGKRRLAERMVNRYQLQSADTYLRSCEEAPLAESVDKTRCDTLARTVHEALQPFWLPVAHGDDVAAVSSNARDPARSAQ